MNPLHNRIRSDKTGRLMTFQAFEPSCVQVCSWKHRILMDFILLQSLGRHGKSLRGTSQLQRGAWVDCKFTGTSERLGVLWILRHHWCFFPPREFSFAGLDQVLCWSEEIRGDKCNLKYQEKHIFTTQKAFCVNFDEIFGQKLRFYSASPDLLAPLREFSAHAFLTCRRTPSSWARRGMCALPTGALFLWQSEILTSMRRTPARLRAARGRVTHCYSSCFSSSLFLAFTFWFIHGSDLKGRSFALEEDLYLQCRQGVSSDPPLFMFRPVLVCLSALIRLLVARQRAAPLQLPSAAPPGESRGVLRQLLQHHLGLPQSEQPGIHVHTLKHD